MATVYRANLCAHKFLISVCICAGQEELCTAFHDVHDPEHFLHAPVRQFYQQALQLFFEASTILLKLWHSLACGSENAGEVPLPPTAGKSGWQKLSCALLSIVSIEQPSLPV